MTYNPGMPEEEPNMVCVFPAPVWPYAKHVALPLWTQAEHIQYIQSRRAEIRDYHLLVHQCYPTHGACAAQEDMLFFDTPLRWCSPPQKPGQSRICAADTKLCGAWHEFTEH